MNPEHLFNPKSIAIVGASAEAGTVGNVIAKNILELGYGGKIFLVNPKHTEILGRKCYPSLFEVEEQVDLAVIAIPAKFVVSEIEKNADKIKNYVIISAGFSEMSVEGKAREEAIQKLAREKELNILGPNCLGFIVPRLKLNASFAGGMPEAGNVAFVSQSGALAVGIMDIAARDDIRFSYIVSLGNKMEITESEVLEYLENDSDTKVIAMYLEGIKDGKKFLETAARVSKTKPIVILKAGKTEKAQKAISSHTGALAGSDEIISVIFERAGIIRADNLEDFFSLINLISLEDKPKNDKVAIITNAGGPGVLTTDAFSEKDIILADIGEKIKTKLKEFLPEESSVENPIDLLGDAHEDRYKKALSVLSRDERIGSFICVLTPQDQTPVAKIASKIIQFSAKGGSASGGKNKPMVVTVFIGGERVKKAIKKLREKSIPNFNFPESAVRAINQYYKWAKYSQSPLGVNVLKEAAINSERRNQVLGIIEKVKAENRKALYFSEAKEVMKLYGVNTISCTEILPGTDIASDSLNSASFPIVLKIDSDQVLHKTDRGGVVLNIRNQEELRREVSKMQGVFPNEKIIFQPMLSRKAELILGIKKDPNFGPVVLYGLGGIYAEVFRMVNFVVGAADKEEIKEMIMKSKVKFLFQETRGQMAYDIDELAEIIQGISYLASEIPEIFEFDINPLLIYNDGNAAVAVDVKIMI